MRLKQFNLGSFVGGLRYQAAKSMFYMSMLSIFFTSSAAYAQIREWFPWVNYWMIAAFVVALFFIVMLFEHTFIYKSEITYISRNTFGEHNPTTVLLLKMNKKIEALEKKLEKYNSDKKH